MPRVVRSLFLIACALLLFAAPGRAAPATNHLASIRAALQARADALASATDRDSKAKRTVLLQAIKAIDNAESSSLSGDLKTLRKVATRIGGFFDPNDPDVRAAIAAVLPVVEQNLNDLEAAIPAIFSPSVAAQVTSAVQEARALIRSARTPPAGQAGIGDVATFLRDAQKLVEKTLASIAKKDVCEGRGSVRATIDGAPQAPPFAAGEVTKDAGGTILAVDLVGFFYDRAAADPYHEGELRVAWGQGTFRGVGTYPLDSFNPYLLWRDPAGTTWQSVSGTITVLFYDEAKREIRGTFSGTLESHDFTSGTTLTKPVTDGRFRVCRMRFDTR